MGITLWSVIACLSTHSCQLTVKVICAIVLIIPPQSSPLQRDFKVVTLSKSDRSVILPWGFCPMCQCHVDPKKIKIYKYCRPWPVQIWHLKCIFKDLVPCRRCVKNQACLWGYTGQTKWSSKSVAGMSGRQRWAGVWEGGQKFSVFTCFCCCILLNAVLMFP